MQPADATPSQDPHGQHQQHEHHGGIGVYLLVFGGLVLLTGLSFWIGNSAIKDTAPLTAWAAMMAVSVGKAMLVILFFMHLLWEANWKYVLTIPAVMMSVFLILMLVPDIGRRAAHYSGSRWIHAAEGAAVAEQHEAETDHGHGADHPSSAEAGH